MQEAERQLPMLDGDAAAEYNALKEQYPNTLIGFELGGYFLFYDKDAITVKEVFVLICCHRKMRWEKSK